MTAADHARLGITNDTIERCRRARRYRSVDRGLQNLITAHLLDEQYDDAVGDSRFELRADPKLGSAVIVELFTPSPAAQLQDLWRWISEYAAGRSFIWSSDWLNGRPEISYEEKRRRWAAACVAIPLRGTGGRAGSAHAVS